MSVDRRVPGRSLVTKRCPDSISAEMLERLHSQFSNVKQHTDEVAEHKAVVDLLVLTAFSDRRITQQELDQLKNFDANHVSWDAGSFSVTQYLPRAIAKVRAALDNTDSRDRLLSDTVSRLTTPAARQEAVTACTALVDADRRSIDHQSQQETDFLAKVRAALS